MSMDPRLRGAAVEAAPRIAAAICHKDAVRLDRELRRLENQCGYMVARRALDASVHSPEALKHALASSAAGFTRAAVTGSRREATAATLHFVEALVGEGMKNAARTQLARVPVSQAVREALVSATPGLALAAVKQDGHLGQNVAASLASDLVRAKAQREMRSTETFGGGMRNAALESAPSAAFAAVRASKSDGARAVVEFVGRAGVVTVDHIANKFVSANHEDLFAARRSAQGLVKELVLREWLMNREFVMPYAKSVTGLAAAGKIPEPHLAVGAGLVALHPVWRQAWTHVVYTTPRAAAEFAVPLPPDLRKAFLPHYLRTMDACLALEKRFEAQGFSVVSITGENQLIREQFRGQVFSKGKVLPKFPDAQLVIESPAGERTTVNVEYVTKSYTPQMIREKAEAFSGPTVWAVDSYATAAKVAANAGDTADLILV
jgi:hypothetical protein